MSLFKREKKRENKKVFSKPESKIIPTLEELVKIITESLSTNPEKWKVIYVHSRYGSHYELSNGKIAISDSGGIRKNDPYDYVSLPLYLMDRLISITKPFFVAFQKEKERKDEEKNLKRASEFFELL